MGHKEVPVTLVLHERAVHEDISDVLKVFGRLGGRAHDIVEI